LGLLKFLWEDLKSDYKAIRRLIYKDPVAIANLRRNFGDMWWCFKNQPLEILKEYWLWYLMLIAAFAIGWMFSANIYQNKCNQILVDRACDMVIPY